MCLAQTPAHPNIVQFVRTSPTTGTIKWSTEPSAFVGYYYTAYYPTTDKKFPPSYCDPVWNGPGGWVSSFAVDSPGMLKADVLGLDPGADYYAYVAAVETSGWSWGAYSSWEFEETLPVELSSFSATLTAQSYVTLAWTTQSETNLLGYRLYRSETGDLADAMMITPALIPATNTSTTCNYTHADYEVSQNTTYWYWLESVEYNGGNMHGPTTVLVAGDDPGTPDIPETSSIGNVYPNPILRGGTAHLDVNVKAGETATVTIYNTRGQIIRVTGLAEGSHLVNWDGTDRDGNHCSTGLYFYRVSTPTLNQTRKLIIIK